MPVGLNYKWSIEGHTHVLNMLKNNMCSLIFKVGVIEHICLSEF